MFNRYAIQASCKFIIAAIGAAVTLFPALSAFAQAPPSTLERIRETGLMRVGYGDTAPFSYRLPDGKIVGYSIDICRQIAGKLQEKLGLDRLEMEFVYRTPQNRIQLLNDGSIDIECNASTNTSERRKSVAFTYSHFLVSTRYVALARQNMRILEDLRGRSVSVTLGTINVSQITEANRVQKLNLSIVPADSLQAAFDMVRTGRVSAYAMDDVLLSSMIAKSGRPEDFSLSTDLVSKPQPYGFMLRRDDEVFKDTVNDALAIIYRDPVIEETYSRWFEQTIPGENINLKLPMSHELRRAFDNPSQELGD